MSRHIRFIELAQSIAMNTVGVKRAKHCAIIAKGKSLLGVGVNSYDTHPQMLNKHSVYGSSINKANKIHIHAEIHALMSVRYRNLSGCTIYIVRHCSRGLSLSKPCKICLNKILQSEIKQIVYTTNDGYIIERVLHNTTRKIKHHKLKPINDIHKISRNNYRNNKQMGI